jgi:thiol-disulfide isomerase/thioredoxin
MIAAVLGVTTTAAHAMLTTAPSANNAGDPPKQKAPDKPKEKAKEQPKSDKKIAVGSEVDGAITLTDLDAKAHKLSDLRGKVVVIEFWSAHSPDSMAYDKHLAELVTTEEAKGVVFIGIDSDKSDFDPTVKDPNGALKEALKARGLEGKMPLVADKDGALMTKLGGKAAPYSLVIDAKGVLRYSGPADEDPKGEKKDAKHYLSDAIDAAVGAKPAEGGKEPPKK